MIFTKPILIKAKDDKVLSSWSDGLITAGYKDDRGWLFTVKFGGGRITNFTLYAIYTYFDIVNKEELLAVLV